MKPTANRNPLEALHARIRACTACRLSETRQHAVPGEGPGDARLVLVGEAPGRREDAAGRPFCGRSGDLLDRLLSEAGIRRGHAYITSCVKCRPPGNRNPTRDELAACVPQHLEAQIECIAPSLIVLFGKTAAASLLGTDAPVKDLRGTVREQRGRHWLVTYHPAAAMRFPD
ncbi:MAG: uracil-DNA glycosylase, partial [Planctomycetota bacterium]